MNSEEGREEMNANAIEELTSGDGWDWMSLVEGRLPAVANIGIHIFVAQGDHMDPALSEEIV